MIIRKEMEKDYTEVYNLVKTAFAQAEHSDGNEHNLVDALRKGSAFIPELSLVAVEDDGIMGHILFTKIKIGESTQLALAPLAVLPEYQRKGVGTALIKAGHEIAASLGYSYSVVLGSEKYYPRAGYVPAEQYDIMAPFDVPAENFMVFKLVSTASPVKGMVEYAPEFGIE